jgi:hypothetical protein
MVPVFVNVFELVKVPPLKLMIPLLDQGVAMVVDPAVLLIVPVLVSPPLNCQSAVALILKTFGYSAKTKTAENG